MFRSPLRLLLAPMLAVVLLFSSAMAQPITPDQARDAAMAWLARAKGSPKGHLRTTMGATLDSLLTVEDEIGNTLYHVALVQSAARDGEQGVVVLAADDRLAPVVLFGTGDGVLDPAGPAADILAYDARQRLGRLDMVARADVDDTRHEGWTALIGDRDETTDAARTIGLLESLDAPRVAPLLESRWNQGSVGDDYCYNYYTPNHYYSGCVATAMGQVMRYFDFPQTGPGMPSFVVTVDDIQEIMTLRGGDGAGGAYSWDDMPYVPADNATQPQRQAIGSLMADMGASVNMEYTEDWAGAYMQFVPSSLTRTFGYDQAVVGSNNDRNLPQSCLQKMLNPNLDAGLPVLIAIQGYSGGHAVVADGYGYDDNILYHHINMGWSGAWDYWYNLPYIVDGEERGFSTVPIAAYNIFTEGSGEIVSGRVLDAEGAAVAGADVAADCGEAGIFADTTDAQGVYAFTLVPSESTCTVTVANTDLNFDSQQTATGTSTEDSMECGNVWGLDFQALKNTRDIPNIRYILLGN